MNEDELTEEDVMRYLEECNESQDIFGFCYIPEIVCSKILDLYQKEKDLNQELQIRYKIENDKYKEEKEKNKIKDTIIEKYQVIATNPDNYIHKGKIRELLEKYDKAIAWANEDDHYYFVKFIQKLLEEKNGKQM